MDKEKEKTEQVDQQVVVLTEEEQKLLKKSSVFDRNMLGATGSINGLKQ
jgi:hypothetical protein